MSTDRELLELAAKAAGGEISTGRWNGEKLHIYTGEKSYTWNPLTDDGDALRLAVKMDLCITQWRHHKNDPAHVMVGYRASPTNGANWIEDYNGDEMAANRRAIVCAVAEMVKAMP